MLGEKAWLAVSALIHPKGALSGRGKGQSSSSTPNSLIHVFMDLALCTGPNHLVKGRLWFGVGFGLLVPVKGTFKALAYQDILGNFMLPAL